MKDRGLSAPEGVRTIAVFVFENRTSETGLETVFSNDLACEFTRSKVVRLVDAGRADAVVRGVIKSMRDRSISYAADFKALERRVTIELDMTLMRRDGRILWSNSALSDEEAYRVGDSREANDIQRRRAIGAISQRLAQRVHNQILEDF